MTIEEKLNSLKYRERIQVEIIENRLGLVYIGQFGHNNTHYFYMTDDNGKQIAIPKEFIKDINKV